MLDRKLLTFLEKEFDIKKPESVKSVHLFGILYDEEGYLDEDNPIVHHSIQSLDEFTPPSDRIIYHRMMIIFKSGGNVAYDINMYGCQRAAAEATPAK